MVPDEHFIPIFTKFFQGESLNKKENRYVKTWIRNYTPNSARGSLAFLIILINVVLLILLEYSRFHEYSVHIITVTFFSGLIPLDYILKKISIHKIRKLYF